MITAYGHEGGSVVAGPLSTVAPTPPPGLVWIDVHQPSVEEKALVEAATGIAIPTPEQMREIEPSSRLFQANGALFMTASVLHRSDSPDPETRAMTFLIVGGMMVSIRYSTPVSFETFVNRIHQQPSLIDSAESTLIGLLDAIIDRIADALEFVDVKLNTLASTILALGSGAPRASKDYKEELRQIGQNQVRCSKADESLVSLTRVLTFLDANMRQSSAKQLRQRIKSLQRDVQSLLGYEERLEERLTFLLEATLGAINIEQTKIIKLFSVVAVVFLPPTLIASIYGMNFDMMPELHWPYGYLMALVLMVISAILPYAFFKYRGWL
ncbi:MAG TPA: magnesium transporter CorA family protein [Rhodospirillales bacterium]|nr:magnesium transporter CorA family protein [Rhodospirillales bacterium]